MRVTNRFVAVIAVLALAGTACSDGSDGSDGETDPGTATVDAGGDDTSDDASGDDGAASATGGTLRFGVNFVHNDWNNLTKPNETYMALVYEKLVALESDGVTLMPQLATDWEETEDLVRFHLKEGVTFHDGTPFDVDAVVANYERISGTPSAWSHIFNAVTDVVVEDEHTVTFELSRPDPELLQNLARRGGFMVSPSAIEADTVASEPVGTSPWVYNEGESVEDATYVFDKFPDYHEPDAVGADRIEVVVIPERETRINSLIAGEVDVIAAGTADRAQLEDAGMGFVAYPALRYHFNFLDREGVFADPLVRQAVCHSIDRDAMIEGQWDGLTEKASQRLLEGVPGYNESVEDYEYDPERAQELLAEAGNPDVSFTMPTFPEQDLAIQILASQMAEAGIELTVDSLTVPQYFSEYLSGAYEAVYNTSSAEDVGPVGYYNYRWAEGAVANPQGVTHAELDDIIERGQNATDLAEQEAIWQEFPEVVHEMALDCGFFDFPQALGWNPDTVQDVVPTNWFPSTLRYAEAQPTS